MTNPVGAEEIAYTKELVCKEEPTDTEELAYVREPADTEELVSRVKLIVIYYKYQY